LLLIRDYTSVAGVHQVLGLIVFNELKLEDFFEACVDRILRVFITLIAHSKGTCTQGVRFFYPT
jgi:hypothetical protein